MLKTMARYFVRKNFCRTAIDEHADLSDFKEKLTPSIITGIILVAFSYAIGLPTVVAFGAIATSMKQPLIGVIGGALIYGISTIMFIIGIKMAGKKYFIALSRWLVRIILEKILGPEAKSRYPLSPEGSGNEQPKN
ncbi:MAG: hypothetical protein AB2L12_09050 [Smithellaceae bacterium]